MAPGDRFHSKNRMFWRADEALKALSREQRWGDFHRACGRSGLFFDDIDPINEDAAKKSKDGTDADVTDKIRGRGYQAIAFRASEDRRGGLIQLFVSKGTGQTPVDAVRDAYLKAIEAGDKVEPGLESILEGAPARTPEPEPADDFDIDALIG